MAILMQVFGRASAALYQGAVFQQQQVAVAGQTCAAQDRLNVWGVAPMVLTEAANRLTADNLASATHRLGALLRVDDGHACRLPDSGDEGVPASNVTGTT
jgi:hypothetical protein